jgi:hypothetical protein
MPGLTTNRMEDTRKRAQLQWRAGQMPGLTGSFPVTYVVT